MTTTKDATQFARFIRTYDSLREAAPTFTAEQIAELKGILNKALTPEAFTLQRAAERFGLAEPRPTGLSAVNGFGPTSDFGTRSAR